jgi:anti-sigma regulatory factor (Ser/Thr protein kinase)
MESSRDGKISADITERATPDAIPGLVKFVSTHAWEGGFEDEKIRDIGLAVEEAINNIIRFACPDGKGDIKITCNVHESGALIINIEDTGKAFNMLLASTFPEAADFAGPGPSPSTSLMKKAIKNIEYRRDVNRNILIFTLARL